LQARGSYHGGRMRFLPGTGVGPATIIDDVLEPNEALVLKTEAGRLRAEASMCTGTRGSTIYA
jgi:hypothetical protein